MKRAAVFVGGAAVATMAGLAALGLVMATHPSSASAATTCTPTGFYRDNTNLTAAEINPTGVVSGAVDAAGCDIGVYYAPGATGTVDKATVENARYFGVVNNGGVVTVENSDIHNIGDSPSFTGGQHGVAVYWAYGSAATGRIVNNTISRYQKGGIVVNGAGSSAEISGNTVTGLGPVNFIAQNGIQVGYGATANVMHNTVAGNSYSGNNQADAGGILVVGGVGNYGGPYETDVEVVGNTVTDNDVGIWLTNLDANYNPPTTPTNIKVANNTISNSSVNNQYVFPGYVGYQAGIADQGNNDKIIHNTISGAGYDPTTSKTAYLIAIDADSSFTNHAKIHANVTN